MKKAIRLLNDTFIRIFLGIFYIFAIGVSFVLRKVLTWRTPKKSDDSYWQTNTREEEQSPRYFRSPY